MGREPVETTTYHYDEQNKLTHTVTVRDSVWLEDDVDWALAWQQEEAAKKADTCPGCKLSLSETTDPANVGRYQVPLPARCDACTRLADTAKEYAESDPGLIFHAELPGD